MSKPHEREFAPLKVTFHLDGTGVYYDTHEPPMLDSLIAWSVLPFGLKTNDLQRDDRPEEVSVPLKQWHIGGFWGYHASALFPADGDPAYESVIMWRKRFRQGYADLIDKGSPSLTGGPYREHNMPAPLLLCSRLVGWCYGNRYKIRRSLLHIKAIGKLRGAGRGRVVGLEVEHADMDDSLVRDGLAMRHLPKPTGARLVRVRPPYWNNVERVPCCEILEPYTI